MFFMQEYRQKRKLKLAKRINWVAKHNTHRARTHRTLKDYARPPKYRITDVDLSEGWS